MFELVTPISAEMKDLSEFLANIVTAVGLITVPSLLWGYVSEIKRPTT
jgi:hypothetical protein